MSFFEGMNRKQKREFKKLPHEQQAELIQAALIQKMSPTMSKEITKAMILGMDLVWEQLYTDCVEPFDKSDSDIIQEGILEDMLSIIRKEYARIQANKAKDGQQK